MSVAVQVSSAARKAIAKRSAERGEDKPCGIEIEQGFEPRPTLLQGVRALPPDRAAGLFSRFSPWRWRNRDWAEVDAATPRPARRTRISSRLRSRSPSGAAITAARSRPSRTKESGLPAPTPASATRDQKSPTLEITFNDSIRQGFLPFLRKQLAVEHLERT